MAKVKTAFFCQTCGVQAAKWVGKCPACGEWNTYVEEVVQNSNQPSSGNGNLSISGKQNKPQELDDIVFHQSERMQISDLEFNRVLGGGMVPGAAVLLGGEPGIGKSTLLLQIALSLSNKKILYVTGEESAQQIKLRAQRIGKGNCTVLTEVLLENVLQHAAQLQPDLIIIDSIQTLHTQSIENTAGSVSQIRACAARVIAYAKDTLTPALLIGHINKEGHIAGPKVLEHMVDVVLQFEGDRNHVYRILRAAKNRYGATSEIGIYEMGINGLDAVKNPSGILLSQNETQLSGTAICVAMEGIRPILMEVQALVSSAAYGTPQRSTTGFDIRRLNMLLAVLEKRAGFPLMSKDVFLNITGGIRVDDPAIDLAVVAAIMSSFKNETIAKNLCFCGEVGLTGEIRPLPHIDSRLQEAEKLGFTSVIIPKHNFKQSAGKKVTIKTIAVDNVNSLLPLIF